MGKHLGVLICLGDNLNDFTVRGKDFNLICGNFQCPLGNNDVAFVN